MDSNELIVNRVFPNNPRSEVDIYVADRINFNLSERAKIKPTKPEIESLYNELFDNNDDVWNYVNLSQYTIEVDQWL